MGVVPRSIPRRAWWAISVVVLTATSCSSTSTASPTPTDQISVLGCQDVIASQPTPPSDSSTFLGGVALPTGRALQVNSSGNTDAQGTLFAKDALIIRRGASFDLVVPEQWRGRLTLIWGSLGKPTDHLRVPGCRPAQRMPSSSHWAVTDDWLVSGRLFRIPVGLCFGHRQGGTGGADRRNRRGRRVSRSEPASFARLARRTSGLQLSASRPDTTCRACFSMRAQAHKI